MIGAHQQISESLIKLSACHKSEELASKMMDEIASNTTARGGSIYLKTPKGYVLVKSLDPGHTPERLNLPLRTGSVFELAVSKGKSVSIKDIKKNKKTKRSGWGGYNNCSAMAIPVRRESGEVIGLISLHDKVSPPFNNDDEIVGNLLASCFAGKLLEFKVMEEEGKIPLNRIFDSTLFSYKDNNDCYHIDTDTSHVGIPLGNLSLHGLHEMNGEQGDSLESDIHTFQLEDFTEKDNPALETLHVIQEISRMGFSYLKHNNYDKAEECFQKILDFEENNSYALVGLGDLYRKRNNNEEALVYYKKCLKNHPSNPYALLGMGIAYKAIGDYENAIEVWERYIGLNSQDPSVITMMADAYRKTKDYEKSKEYYLSALTLEPENRYALTGLGYLYLEMKEYELALKSWDKVITQDDGKNIRLLTNMGNCYRKLKDYEEGLTYFQKARDIEPENFYVLYGMADCYRGLDRHDASLDCWKEILNLGYKNEIILTKVGDAYKNLGDLETAMEYYTKALDTWKEGIE